MTDPPAPGASGWAKRWAVASTREAPAASESSTLEPGLLRIVPTPGAVPAAAGTGGAGRCGARLTRGGATVKRRTSGTEVAAANAAAPATAGAPSRDGAPGAAGAPRAAGAPSEAALEAAPGAAPGAAAPPRAVGRPAAGGAPAGVGRPVAADERDGPPRPGPDAGAAVERPGRANARRTGDQDGAPAAADAVGPGAAPTGAAAPDDVCCGAVVGPPVTVGPGALPAAGRRQSRCPWAAAPELGAPAGLPTGRITSGVPKAVARERAASLPCAGLRRTVISSGIATSTDARVGVVDTCAPIRLAG